MAMMARVIGIPSRVSVGFLPGERDEKEGWKVSIRDMHAWPELYFANYGWVRSSPRRWQRDRDRAIVDCTEPTLPEATRQQIRLRGRRPTVSPGTAPSAGPTEQPNVPGQGAGAAGKAP